MDVEVSVDPESITLPKWPQMLVTGEPVTVEQAKEIIFRTDDFLTDVSEYAGGNNRQFNESYRRMAGLDAISNDYDAQEELCQRLKVLPLRYIENDWASCCFVGGPHGWCHPDGTIAYGDNIGKWPSLSEVLSDWQCVATNFPFLKCNITLMDGESCEERTLPLVNISVADGQAKLLPHDVTVHAELPQRSPCRLLGRLTGGYGGEIGLPDDWYDEFAGRVKAAIEQMQSKGA